MLGVLEAEPLHGPSYRKGLEEGYAHMARAWEQGYDARGVDISNEGLTYTTMTPNPYRDIPPGGDRA